MNDRINIDQDQKKVVPHGGMSRTSWPKWTGSALLREPYATINGLQATRRAEVAGEKRLSGVNIELNELQIALDELFDDTQKEKELGVGRDEEKKKNEDNEKAKTEEVRKIAMETHGQSKKRESEQGEDADH